MNAITLRWEWRTFGTDFGDAERRFSELQAGETEESDELYFLGAGDDANVKIRDRRMDIKLLEQVDAAGLQQWRPTMKGDFPLPAAEAAKVCDALRVPPLPPLESYTLERLRAELTHPSRGVRAVPVHKRRTRYRIGACLAERTAVIAAGRPTHTVAIELENPARVLAAVRSMGLDRFDNISYPRGLRALLGPAS
jgi:exopolyphosphatase/guanosine-5'-triphosphate,3'-diphosphate pyrophosphatase